MRLKIRRGIGVSPIAVLLAVCAVSSLVSGMFEHRHCDHQHPQAHEVGAIPFMSIAKGDSNLSSLCRPYSTPIVVVFLSSRKYTYVCLFRECDISIVSSVVSDTCYVFRRLSHNRVSLFFSVPRRVFNLVEGMFTKRATRSAAVVRIGKRATTM